MLCIKCDKIHETTYCPDCGEWLGEPLESLYRHIKNTLKTQENVLLSLEATRRQVSPKEYTKRKRSTMKWRAWEKALKPLIGRIVT
jgi:hypothetical protein